MNNGDSPLQEIDHIVVLMLENRSFDNLLGRLYTGKNATKKGFDPMPLDSSNEVQGEEITVWTNDDSILDS